MKKFIPKNNQLYWYLDGDINWPEMITVVSDSWDSELLTYSALNCFRTQKDALRNIIQTLTRLNKDSLEVEKATMTCEINNGKTVTRIEVVSRQPNAQ